MTSKLVVNTIEADTGISSVSFASSISMNSTAKFHFSNAGIDIGADTNINRPAAGVLGFNINGSEKVRIQSNGRIGMGTASPPDCTLTVCEFNSGTEIYDNIALRLQGSTGQNVALQFTDTTGAAAYIAVQGDALRLGTSNAEKLRIDSSGRVLIGTTTEGETSADNLTIADSGNCGITIRSGTSNAGGIYFSDGTSGDAEYRGLIAYNQPSDYLQIFTGAAEKLRITSGGSVNIGGDYTQTSRKLAVNGSALFKATEADIWLESTGPNAVWRILGSTGGNTHQFRIYDNTNAADRFVIDSNGRVIIGDTSTTNASGNADDLVISGSGQKGITIHSTVYGNIYFSDGSGSNQYVGYCQYNHNNNHLNLGAGGAQRVMIYDKDGASGTTKAVLQVGGSAGNNHYNNYQNASITFGGGNDIENYFIGTRMENYGGNYTKLDLRWHTGIRMGAQAGYGGIRFYDNEDLGSVKFSIMSGGDFVTCHTTLRPAANNTYNLGNSSYRWGTLYASNATNTSDRNEKNTITESDLGLDFICKLKPVSYKWNQLVDREGEGLDTKTHYGLISQDVEESVIASGKTLDDFGAIDKPEGDDPMGLSYHEFISPLIKAIQEQQEQIKILQEKIASLEES